MSIAKRIISLGLAVWFGALSVSIETLHRHPSGCGGTVRHGCSLDVGHFPGAVLSDTPRSDSGDNHPYCPACLFVKSCNQQAVAWAARQPAVAPATHLPCYDPGVGSFQIVHSCSPRAPPTPLT